MGQFSPLWRCYHPIWECMSRTSQCERFKECTGVDKGYSNISIYRQHICYTSSATLLCKSYLIHLPFFFSILFIYFCLWAIRVFLTLLPSVSVLISSSQWFLALTLLHLLLDPGLYVCVPSSLCVSVFWGLIHMSAASLHVIFASVSTLIATQRNTGSLYSPHHCISIMCSRLHHTFFSPDLWSS